MVATPVRIIHYLGHYRQGDSFVDMLPSNLFIYFLSYIVEDLEDSLALRPTGKNIS